MTKMTALSMTTWNCVLSRPTQSTEGESPLKRACAVNRAKSTQQAQSCHRLRTSRPDSARRPRALGQTCTSDTFKRVQVSNENSKSTNRDSSATGNTLFKDNNAHEDIVHTLGYGQRARSVFSFPFTNSKMTSIFVILHCWAAAQSRQHSFYELH